MIALLVEEKYEGMVLTIKARSAGNLLDRFT